MDTSTSLNLNDLFSAKGLVVVVSGGGTGIVLPSLSRVPETNSYKELASLSPMLSVKPGHTVYTFSVDG